ncbi:MAG: tRNA preQ1(34) S-adenosylmethionine ribosyltransferase-isomerase QueA [Armatimonadota bacterium]|jgi:S-adenosylmethionine:tRNA ribosyltransferase-isomerase
MRTRDFDYDLPRELIAQEPASRRDESRLMVLHRDTRQTAHRRFGDIVGYLQPGDCLVLNDTKVIPARLMGRRPTGGRTEVLLLEPEGGEWGGGVDARVWQALVRPGRRARPGTVIAFGDGDMTAKVTKELADGVKLVKLEYEGELASVLDRIGQAPLPPYIQRQAPRAEDDARYQTVYARLPGAVAAPTAGLHFTEELLERIRAAGVTTTFITLHVGLGTFKPVDVERVEEHHMHAERFHISPAAADAINACRSAGGRVVAVGTTVTRTLESVCDDNGQIVPTTDRTELFIYPGYEFRVVDVLLTNFHLPRSTLLMLVAAFCGRELIIEAYQEAVEERYRFYSYGDGMVVL